MPEVENITPQNNHFLLGQEAAENVFLEAYNSGKLHNSWLISGVKGIGKATLAYKFARFLLNFGKVGALSLATNPESTANRLIDSNSHPDFKIIEREFIEKDRQKVIKAIKSGDALDDDELRKLKKSSVIRIDDVRTINEFMSKTASQNGWKVVIIDSIDDMNTASANALLKVLEEPPANSILLLISHSIGQLLPTIRSRCNKLVLKPLDDSIVVSLLRRYRPELDEPAIKGLAKISSGSIGKAINYADFSALSKYNKLSDIIYAGKSSKLSDLLLWVDAATVDDDSYFLACELVLKFLSNNVVSSPEVMLSAWDEANRIFRQTDSLNMDRKQALINVIEVILC